MSFRSFHQNLKPQRQAISHSTAKSQREAICYVDFIFKSHPRLAGWKMHALWRMRSAKFRSLIRLRISSSRMTQSAFPFFSRASFADSEIGGYSTLKVVEKPVAPLAASLSPSLLDAKKLKAISRVSEIGSSGKLRPQVLYLMELGMDLDQIKRSTGRYLEFPFHSLEGKIKPLVEFLLDLGVPKSDIPSILSRRPQLCGYSLSENIIPTIEFLESLGVDKKQWAKVIYRYPGVFCHSRQKVKSTVDFLYEMDLSAESIGNILTRFPRIIAYSVEDKLRPISEYFRSLGVVDLAVLIFRAPQIFNLSIEINLKHVTEFFLERGFRMEEVGTMISRFAVLYMYSLDENLKPKWEFFLTMVYQQSELVKFPAYFGYSLERRIKPRYALMKERGVVLPLSSLLALSSDGLDKALKMKMNKKTY